MEILPNQNALQYSHPVGEGGTGVRGALRSNSAIRVFAFESQHKAEQRRVAENRGLEIKNQDIKIKFTGDGEGGLVASGGVTESEIADESGNSTELRELALLSTYGASTAAFFGDSKKALPQLFLFDSFSSRLAIENRPQSFDLNKSNFFTRSLFGENQVDTESAQGLIDKVRRRIEDLDGALTRLNNLSPFSNRLAISSANRLKINSVDNNTATGVQKVEVDQIAKSRQLAFDVVPNDNMALNQGGSLLGPQGFFSLNGVKVSVKATDTIVDIKNAINYGEDLNRNNRLDYSEDVNNNRSLDAGEDRNQNRYLDTTEDVNQNGVLDSGEDLNANGRLDVSEDRDFDNVLDLGTEQHGVRAFIDDNQLILESMDPSGRIQISDDDGILENLGLIERDFYETIQFKNEVFSGQEALVTVDGSVFRSNNNQFSDVLEGIDFSVSSHKQEAVSISVSESVQGAFSSINEVVSAFNEVQRGLNDILKPSGIFRDNRHAQLQKSAFTNAYRQDGQTLQNFGVTQQRDRVELDELQIRSASSRINNGQPNVFSETYGLPTVRNSIGHFALTDESDATLSIDSNSLKQSLMRDVENAEKVLGQGGLLSRLESEVNTALFDQGGGLSFIDKALSETQNQKNLLSRIEGQLIKDAKLGSNFNLVA